MGPPIFYCKSRFRAKKRPTALWSETDAKKAHDSGQPYVALVDSIDRPFCFLEITPKAIGVSFLDEFLRESLSYDFQEVEPGLLFLTMATYREFDGNTDLVVSGTSYIFSRDGQVQIRRESFNLHRVEAAASSANVSANYSPMARFGRYEELIHVERGLSVSS